MKKNTYGIACIVFLSGLFIMFQNFTEPNYLDLSEHPAFKIIESDNYDLTTRTLNHLPSCKMVFEPHQGDKYLKIWNIFNHPAVMSYNANGKEVFYQGISYSNSNPNQRRTISLESPIKNTPCVFRGKIEIVENNIALNCKSNFIDGTFLPREIKHSGITIGKEFLSKSNLIPLYIDEGFRQRLLIEKLILSASQDVFADDLMKFYYLTGNNILKEEIKSRITTKDIIVENCNVRNFTLNGIHVDWRLPDAFKSEIIKDLSDRQTWGPHNILIENNVIKTNDNVGVYLDDHSFHNKIINNKILGNTIGIYLEYHSSKNEVSKNSLYFNGFKRSTFTDINGNMYNSKVERVREAISIDSSTNNIIKDNFFHHNAKGGIHLYKNCGEGMANPSKWVASRELGADENVIDSNYFVSEQVGVWIASRQDARSPSRMKCGDKTPYSDITESFDNQKYPIYFLDKAKRNIVKNNNFIDTFTGIKVQDSHNIITGNTFKGIMANLVSVGSRMKANTKYSKSIIEMNEDVRIKGTVIADNSSYVEFLLNYPLYDFFTHPIETIFDSNHHVEERKALSTCSPIVNLHAVNDKSKTCEFYLNKGDLSDGSISTFLDPTKLINLQQSGASGTYGNAQLKCEKGKWRVLSNTCYYLD